MAPEEIDPQDHLKCFLLLLSCLISEVSLNDEDSLKWRIRVGDTLGADTLRCLPKKVFNLMLHFSVQETN